MKVQLDEAVLVILSDSRGLHIGTEPPIHYWQCGRNPPAFKKSPNMQNAQAWQNPGEASLGQYPMVEFSQLDLTLLSIWQILSMRSPPSRKSPILS